MILIGLDFGRISPRRQFVIDHALMKNTTQLYDLFINVWLSLSFLERIFG
jgi:hypothetical protein